MHLELHDAEAGNSHAGTWRNLDYPYQVEQAVQDSEKDHPHIVRWVAFAGLEQLAVWERREGKAVMVSAGPSWTGTWRPGVTAP